MYVCVVWVCVHKSSAVGLCLFACTRMNSVCVLWEDRGLGGNVSARAQEALLSSPYLDIKLRTNAKCFFVSPYDAVESKNTGVEM